MKQVSMWLDLTMEDSRAVSYEGVVQKIHRQYLETGDKVRMYRDMTEYLSRNHSRSQNLKGVSVIFLNGPGDEYSFMVPGRKDGRELLNKFHSGAKSILMDQAGKMDTGILFSQIDGELYMVRNLLNSKFQPYGVLIMMCNQETLFQPLSAISTLTEARISVDDTVIDLTPSGEPREHSGSRELITQYTSEVGGHRLHFEAMAMEKNLWGVMPALRWAVAAVLLLVLPLLAVAVFLLYRHVTKPVKTIVEASNRVEAGERGYQITQIPRNQEFATLASHFNSMSKELESQFQRLYLEQQSLQEARIKALQSQINPHFLGNTLEIINWEARLANDDKVSAMIEALSTMMDAAIGRDGRSVLPLREELTYADAYLYIIQERMGDGLKVRKEIDESLLSWGVPRLILQPLLENAVEHDISRRRGTLICIRVYRRLEQMVIEVEHEGTISPEDRNNIERLLSEDAAAPRQKGKVGIQNLNQRIKLICGNQYRLTIEETEPGRVIARSVLPFLPVSDENQEMGK